MFLEVAFSIYLHRRVFVMVWIAKDAKIHRTDNEDSDQTARTRRLICIFVGSTCLKLRFLMFWLILLHKKRCRTLLTAVH